MIAIVDYGMGNRRSVEKALAHVGAAARITRDHRELRAADGLVVPGVGAFPRAMDNLRDLGLDELLRERVAHGVPVLGICLGLQLGFESSTEHGGATGLGFVPGAVQRLDSDGLKLPQIGWNVVEFTRVSPLTEGLPDRCAFYHVHSYAPVPADEEDVLGTAVYAAPFVSAVERDGFYGVQFHPEKSSGHGLRLLANFAGICARQAADALA
jgi:glutamine amidotransferase